MDATEREESRHRYMRRTAIGALPFRFASVTTGVLEYSIASRVLTSTSLALWLAITSVATLLGFADLGLGASITTEVAQIREDDPDRADRVTVIASSGTVLLLLVGGAVLLITVLLTVLSPIPNAIAKAHHSHAPFIVASVVIAAGIPAAGALRVLHGLQRGGLANGLMAGSIVASFGGFAIQAWVMPNASLLVFWALSAPPMAGLVGVWALRKTKSATLRRGAVQLDVATALVRRGRYFFLLAVASAMSFGADTIVLSVVAGPGAVVEYSAVYRMFNFLPLLMWLALSGLWPAVASAMSSRDFGWVRASARKLLATSVALNSAFALALLPVAPAALRWWLGGAVHPKTTTLVCAAAFAVSSAAYAPAIFLLNGLGEERYQTRLLLVIAPLNLLSSILLAKPLGAAGPILASAAATTIAAFFMFGHAFRRLRSEEARNAPPAAI